MAFTGQLQEYLDDEENYTVFGMKWGSNPRLGWALPYKAGSRYRIHWGEGLDLTQMQLELSEHWVETDEPIYINMNFTNAREQVRFKADYGGQNIVVANETLT